MFEKAVRVATIAIGASSLMIGGMASAGAAPDDDDYGPGECESFSGFTYCDSVDQDTTTKNRADGKISDTRIVTDSDYDVSYNGTPLVYGESDSTYRQLYKDGEPQVEQYRQRTEYGSEYPGSEYKCTHTVRFTVVKGEERNRQVKDSNGENCGS